MDLLKQKNSPEKKFVLAVRPRAHGRVAKAGIGKEEKMESKEQELGARVAAAEKMRSKKREFDAKEAADRVMSDFNLIRDKEIVRDFLKGVDIGIILGTGWGDVLEKEIDYVARFQLENVVGFEFLQDLEEIEGHDRELVVGYLQDKKVAMLRGRIHMNESHDGEKIAQVVRLQVEMLFHLGIKHLILTNAAGSLRPEVEVGHVVAHTGFITPFAPPRPLWGGEFISSAEDVLKEKNNKKIILAAHDAGLICAEGAGAMVRGPDFEGRKHDKRILREAGATMAMMSILPEATVAALYPDVEVYAISNITNTASEVHSHAENQKRAQKTSGKLGNMLLNLIDSF